MITNASGTRRNNARENAASLKLSSPSTRRKSKGPWKILNRRFEIKAASNQGKNKASYRKKTKTKSRSFAINSKHRRQDCNRENTTRTSPRGSRRPLPTSSPGSKPTSRPSSTSSLIPKKGPRKPSLPCLKTHSASVNAHEVAEHY